MPAIATRTAQANQRHGEGTFYYTNGDTYTGEFSRDVRNGQGTFTRASDGLVYHGRWRRDLTSGNECGQCGGGQNRRIF